VSVADRERLVDDEDGSTFTATENASRMYMPDEYVFTGRSMKLPSSENSRIAGSRCLTSSADRPRMAALRAALSRPVNSG
jgi:hypothetical protein